MSASTPFTCRRIRSSKRWAVATVIAMIASTVSPLLVPTVHAQTAPVGAGFALDAEDLRFIFHGIEIAQAHAVTRTPANPCGTLLGPGRNQVNLFGTPNPQLPLGLRTVDGSCNNLVPDPDQHLFGASDQLFPRLTTPNFRNAEQGTSYSQLSGDVIDSQPRIISNLINDQTAANPAAAAAAANVCGSGGFVCSGAGTPDPGPIGAVFPADKDTGSIFIPNTTPDFGLSAPFNLMFTFFGQFFDHGLDLVNKGGNGTVLMPLQPDDPLFRTGVDPAFNTMTMPRASVDANHNSVNQTTPWVDQNQTYTSHPSHQVFLRQYVSSPTGPVPDGRMLDSNGFCSPRGTGFAGDQICNIGNWGEVKAQARTKLGINLTDANLFDVPLLLTDPYGHFKPGPRGFPQLVLPGNALREGDPTANGGLGVSTVGALTTNHQFLNDVAHNAVPTPGGPDADLVAGTSLDPPTPAGCNPATTCTYDNELLDLHFVTGDGRGNENIALTSMHTLFHSEHNRLRAYIDNLIHTPGVLTAAEISGWETKDNASGWTYGERLFQAARFATEMQYQHLVFEEFARKMQPLINPFLGGITNINGSISAEFAHTVYRLGHSMLPESIARINADGSANNKRLFDAFLNPAAFNDGGTAGPLPAAKAAGSIFRGLSRQVGNELDEFITASVRNTLVGLPLDLPAVNIARGRSEGIPSLNSARRQFFTATRDSSVTPYANWFDFSLNLKHRDSVVNFIAAYGKGANAGALNTATTVAAKRAAANLALTNNLFMFEPAATSGLDDVDFWPGGLAERQAAFGGLLGSTFNFVFEKQLENLQNGDRFYYLQRTDGLNFRFQLESNSLAELAMRNSDVSGLMQNSFETADFNFDMTALTGTDPIDLGIGDPSCAGCQLLTMISPTGNAQTKVFFDPLHRGKNVVFNGTSGNDRAIADIGDDTMYGNAGNDRMEGGDGNDTLVGGDGDDILFGGNGDDVLKGGPGDDALASGPGFGADILMGGEGNDFLLGGNDGVEHFGGAGDDIMLDGDQRAEGMFGGDGDDWLEAGDGHDGGIFGDGGNVFDLTAGLSAVGGDDVLEGGPGQDNHFGEGGDDIMRMSEGSNKFFGDFGFDWITLYGWPIPENIQLFLLALPNAPVNFNDLRNKYRFVDGASGWDLNDHIQGSNSVLCLIPGEIAECLVVGMELKTGTPPVAVAAKNVPGQVNFRGGSGAAKIGGLPALIAAFGKSTEDPAIPGVKGVGYMAGDILLGGRGNDVLEGMQGDDLIDGDLWLQVQLRAVLNDGTVKLVDSGRDLIDDVFADDPAFAAFNGQRLNPGNISIIRSIITPGNRNPLLGPVDPNPAPAPPPDCNKAVPLNCDTAVFSGNLAEYDITANANGTITVHDNGRPVGVPSSDGTDTLRNIERLQFADVTIDAPRPRRNVIVPNVVGLSTADATAAIIAADLVVGELAEVSSATVPIGIVVGTSPAAGATALSGSRITVSVVQGAPLGDVTAVPVAQAQAAIIAAGLVPGAVTLTSSTTVAIGIVISQDPAALTRGLVLGSSVALVASTGTVVPNVVNTAQALATTTINAAGLAVGTVTTANSNSVQAGRVISQSLTAGTSVNPGSTVNLVVSLGPVVPAATISGTIARGTSGTATVAPTNTITTANGTGNLAANTLLVAFVSANNGTSNATNTVVNSVTNLNGAVLTWTLAQRSNVQLGTAEIWWAFTPTAHNSTTVRATLNRVEAAAITVMTFTGADPSLVGAASLAANSSGGAIATSLTTTRDNSWVFAVGTDWDRARTLTPGAGQTIVNQFTPNVGDTYWLQRTTNAVPVAGFAPISDTYAGANTDRWNVALIEIRHQ